MRSLVLLIGSLTAPKALSAQHVVITPHAAYYSEEAIRTVRDFAAHEVARVLTGQPPLSPVNAAQLATGQPRHSA